MRCLKEKELVLFFYKEMPDRRYKRYKRHLDKCLICQRRYREIENFLSVFKEDKPFISQKDIDEVLGKVMEKVKKIQDEKSVFSINIGLFNLRKWLFSFYGRVAIATLSIFVLFIASLSIKKYLRDKEWTIFEIELLLSYEDIDEVSFFDEYNSEDDSILLPIPQSKREEVHIRT